MSHPAPALWITRYWTYDPGRTCMPKSPLRINSVPW